MRGVWLAWAVAALAAAAARGVRLWRYEHEALVTLMAALNCDDCVPTVLQSEECPTAEAGGQPPRIVCDGDGYVLELRLPPVSAEERVRTYVRSLNVALLNSFKRLRVLAIPMRLIEGAAVLPPLPESLEELDISGNDISDIFTAFTAPNLRVLKAAGNTRAAVLLGWFASRLGLIEHVDLDRCGVTVNGDEDLIDVLGRPHLRHLSLDDNAVTSRFTTPAVPSPRLTHLSIARNRLRDSIGAIANLQTLRYVDLSSNELSGDVSSVGFQFLAQLVYIDLRGNTLTGDLMGKGFNLVSDCFLSRLAGACPGGCASRNDFTNCPAKCCPGAAGWDPAPAAPLTVGDTPPASTSGPLSPVEQTEQATPPPPATLATPGGAETVFVRRPVAEAAPFPVGAVVGAAVGVVALSVCIAAIAFWSGRRRARPSPEPTYDDAPEIHLAETAGSPELTYSGALSPQAMATARAAVEQTDYAVIENKEQQVKF